MRGVWKRIHPDKNKSEMLQQGLFFKEMETNESGILRPTKGN